MTYSTLLQLIDVHYLYGQSKNYIHFSENVQSFGSALCLKIVVFQIDRNYPSYVILTSVPPGRVLTLDPARVLCPHWLRSFSGGSLFLGIGFALANPGSEYGDSLLSTLFRIAPIGIGSMGVFYAGAEIHNDRAKKTHVLHALPSMQTYERVIA